MEAMRGGLVDPGRLPGLAGDQVEAHPILKMASPCVTTSSSSRTALVLCHIDDAGQDHQGGHPAPGNRIARHVDNPSRVSKRNGLRSSATRRRQSPGRPTRPAGRCAIWLERWTQACQRPVRSIADQQRLIAHCLRGSRFPVSLLQHWGRSPQIQSPFLPAVAATTGMKPPGQRERVAKPCWFPNLPGAHRSSTTPSGRPTSVSGNPPHGPDHEQLVLFPQIASARQPGWPHPCLLVGGTAHPPQ